MHIHTNACMCACVHRVYTLNLPVEQSRVFEVRALVPSSGLMILKSSALDHFGVGGFGLEGLGESENASSYLLCGLHERRAQKTRL